MSEDELIEWFSYFGDIFEAARDFAQLEIADYATYFDPEYMVPYGDMVYVYDEFGDSVSISIRDLADYINQ